MDVKRTRLRARNPERMAKRRADAFGPQAELCRALRCCVCGFPPPSDPEHVRTRGAGGKDRDTVPLCRSCHDLRHAKGHAGPFFVHGTARDGLDAYTTIPAYCMPLHELALRFFQHVARGLEALIALTHDQRVCLGCGADEARAAATCETCGGWEWCSECGLCPGCSLEVVWVLRPRSA